MDTGHKKQDLYVRSWHWVCCFFRSNITYVNRLVLLSLWVSKIGLDAGVLDRRSLSRMEARTKVIPIGWHTVGLLLCLWSSKSYVKAQNSELMASVFHETRGLEVTYYPRDRKFHFDRTTTMTVFAWTEKPFVEATRYRTSDDFIFSRDGGLSSFDNLVNYNYKVLRTMDYSGTDIWLYTGKDDPLCHIQVTYSDSLWESNSSETYCLKYMHKESCTYIKHGVQETRRHGFLADSVTLHCYGLKGHFSDIEEQRTRDWTMLYTLSPYNLRTLHGEFMFYQDARGVFHWVTPGIITAGLVYHNHTVTGMIMKNFEWLRVNREYFTLARANSLNDLLGKVALFAREVVGIGQQNYYPPVAYVDCECDKISWVRTQAPNREGSIRSIRGLEVPKRSYLDTYVIPSCEFEDGGLIVGNCSVTTIEQFLTDSHFTEELVDDTKAWYTSLLIHFFNLLKDFVGDSCMFMIKFLGQYLFSFGIEYIVGFLIPYLAIVKVYGNLPAILLSTVCTLLMYNSLNLASEWN